jgi:hypothetical protein
VVNLCLAAFDLFIRNSWYCWQIYQGTGVIGSVSLTWSFPYFSCFPDMWKPCLMGRTVSGMSLWDDTSQMTPIIVIHHPHVTQLKSQYEHCTMHIMHILHCNGPSTGPVLELQRVMTSYAHGLHEREGARLHIAMSHFCWTTLKASANHSSFYIIYIQLLLPDKSSCAENPISVHTKWARYWASLASSLSTMYPF